MYRGILKYYNVIERYHDDVSWIPSAARHLFYRTRTRSSRVHVSKLVVAVGWKAPPGIFKDAANYNNLYFMCLRYYNDIILFIFHVLYMLRGLLLNLVKLLSTYSIGYL